MPLNEEEREIENMAEQKSKFSKNLYLKKGVRRKADGAIIDTVDGGIKLWLKKPYGAQAAFTVREVLGAGRDGQQVTRKVCNVEGSLRVDEFLAPQLKYFFSLDLPLDSFIDVRIALWDKRAEALTKFNPQEKDLFMFILTEIHSESFQRRDGSTGYQLSGSAFDFEPLRTQKRENSTNASAPTQSAVQSDAQSAAPSYVAYIGDDFAAIDDSDDLPF